jgi:hypothetical protein
MAEKTLGQVAYETWISTNLERSLDEFEAVADHVVAAHEARRWRAIDSAPKDVSILIYVPEYDHYGPGILRAIWVRGERWHTTCWASGRDLGSCYTPTHWTTLPAPPQEVE